ncbi:MAG: Curli production assembly/transport component CsgG [Firmicutes bacterium]|nr:Curli production assembly/transport component CsgG [Bacillota bacterium]
MEFLQAKKVVVSVILGTLLCFFSATLPVQCAPKRIGITQFETNNFRVQVPGGGLYDIGLGASDILATELAKNKNFEVIERQQIASVLQEQAFGQSGAVDTATAAKMGNLLGLKYIVYGKILSAGAEDKSRELLGVRVNKLSVKVQIAVRMIDITTGVIVWADQVEGKVEKKGIRIDNLGLVNTQVSASAYDDAIQIAIGKIVERIGREAPTEGSIAKLIGPKIFLDIGVDQGVQPGQLFTVYREGETITNAAGQIIGVDKTDICTIRTTKVEGNMSIAEMVDKKPPLIQEGDKVHSM